MASGLRLDRKLTIGVILALLIQTGTAIWWAGAINVRTANVERQSNGLLEQQIQQRSAISGNASRIGVLEDRWRQLDPRLARIEQRLDRLIDLMTEGTP